MAGLLSSFALCRAVNIEDLRRLARQRLPDVVFDYLDGGAEDEITLRGNRRVFSEATFRPRHAVTVPDCDLHTRILGSDLAFPVLLAPLGYGHLMHPGGEVAAAAAAGEAGVGYILSTTSGYRLKTSRQRHMDPLGQLYLVGGREVAEGAIERARLSRFSALVLTGKGFQPGISGNPNGRPRTTKFSEAARRLAEEIGQNGKTCAEQLAEHCYRCAYQIGGAELVVRAPSSPVGKLLHRAAEVLFLPQGFRRPEVKPR